MPAPGKIKLIKFPPPGQEKTSNARGMPGGMLKLRFDWYIKRNKNQLRDYMTTGPAHTEAARLTAPAPHVQIAQVFLLFCPRGDEYEQINPQAEQDRKGSDKSTCTSACCKNIRTAEISNCSDLWCDHNQASHAKWRSPNCPRYLFLFFLASQHRRREIMHFYKINSPHWDVCLFVISVVRRIQTR